jgi:hypothetical protein
MSPIRKPKSRDRLTAVGPRFLRTKTPYYPYRRRQGHGAVTRDEFDDALDAVTGAAIA